MSDILKAIAQAFGVIGLKVRDPQIVIDRLKAKGLAVSDTDGFLSISQGDTQMNVGQILQACLKQHPEDFVGHSGEIRFKSDIAKDAKVAWIKEHGLAAFEQLPANEKSPGAKNVLQPVILSEQMKAAEWLRLTRSEKIAAIAAWGKESTAIVERILARK